MSYKYSHVREYQGKLLLEDRLGKKQCQMSADGLIITDSEIGKKCILKFENGVLKINGKEIATVENS